MVVVMLFLFYCGWQVLFWFGLGFDEQFVVVYVDVYFVVVDQFVKQQFVGEWMFDFVLDYVCYWVGIYQWIEVVVGQLVVCGWCG